MATSKSQTTVEAAVDEASNVVHQVSREAQVEAYSQMITMVPAGQSDGFDIIVRIASATSWEDVNVSEDGLPDTKDQLGRRLRFESISRRESDKQNDNPWYFVVEATDLKTGEAIRFSTGSQTIMAQLATLYVKGWLPVIGEVVQSERETRAGFRPFALQVDARP